jgi:hypothetical protein
MWSLLLGRLALIQVFDTVAESVDGLREMPREDAPAVVRVGYDCRILSDLAWMTIDAGQPVAATNFPIIILT